MKVLVLSTWFDGGPDEECSAYKVLDENFNEVQLPKVEYPEIIDLYKEDSHDEEVSLDWNWLVLSYEGEYALSGVPEEVRNDRIALKNKWKQREMFIDKMDSVLPEEWRIKFSDDYHEEEALQADALWQEAHDLSELLASKYEGKVLAKYTEHIIGVKEFCERFGINKVIRL